MSRTIARRAAQYPCRIWTALTIRGVADQRQRQTCGRLSITLTTARRVSGIVSGSSTYNRHGPPWAHDVKLLHSASDWFLQAVLPHERGRRRSSQHMMLTERLVVHTTLMVKHRKGVSVVLLAGSTPGAAGRGYAVMACGSQLTRALFDRCGRQSSAAANYVRWVRRSACRLHDLPRSTWLPRSMLLDAVVRVAGPQRHR